MPIKAVEKQITLLIRLLENALRSGYNVQQSLELATKELPSPLLEEMLQTIEEIKSGTNPLDALSNWARRSSNPDVDLVVATFHVQMEVGGNLADKLNLLGQILEHRSK